ncbi:thiol reductant ABC exporter subunit CydC [uncultured Limosilactobacillus sp.]|uniref:thiol reductant ABC exporter subunit CydC n=1 Tax=uncultured Limosilactobacillus sp. TaxID=2837629 RepID=UPI0025CECD18|nr:thiol reductant ABC exporter subunit CydC [uncultured Limosilactobacillus sp.]
MFKKIPLLKALQHDRWIKPFLKRYRWTLVLAIGLGIVTFICGAGLMFSAGFLISKSATRPENILLVYVPIVLTRAFGIARPALRYVERLVSHNWVLKMTSQLRRKLYDSLEHDAVFFHSKYQLGDILGLLSDDVHHIQNLYLRTLFPMFVAWGLYALIVVAFGVLSPLMGLWMLIVFGLIIFGIPIWSILVNGARQERAKQLKDQLYVDLTDNVMGVTDWILAGRNQQYLTRRQQSETADQKNATALHSFEHVRDFLLQMLYLSMIVSVILWGASKFGGHFGGPANWIAAFVLAWFPLVDAFIQLSTAAQETNVYTNSITRLNELSHSDEPAGNQIKLHRPFKLQINDVHFCYAPTQREVLSGISLKLAPGEKVALLGRSGSGKSTLASLIRGDLTPTKGAVKLNDVATSQFGDQIADYIGVINQTPYLFNTTIANNVRLGDETAGDERIWSVLERVGLADMVHQLPDGINTKVDEAGLRFSGGERHRLALARILLKDTPIVLLDEPTVGLDPITEQAVIDTFMNQLQDKTVIWITHHLQGIDQFDQVIFIEAGQLAMHGSPSELWKNNDRFRQLKKADQGIIPDQPIN